MTSHLTDLRDESPTAYVTKPEYIYSRLTRSEH